MTKVAIVGTCPSSRMLSQGLPDDWKIWALAPDNVAVLPRIDLWFEIHGDVDFDWHGDGQNYGPYIAWLNQQTFPVYAQDTRLIPRAMIFPYQELIDRFSPCFFTSTPAWMMALAIRDGVTEIGLYGLDMAAKSEYGNQKIAMHHFVWLAEQKGIKVHAPPVSEVLQPLPLYGYSYQTPMGRKLRSREFELRDRISEKEALLKRTQLELQHFYGALDDNDWTQQTWTGQPWATAMPSDDKSIPGDTVISFDKKRRE